MISLHSDWDAHTWTRTRWIETAVQLIRMTRYYSPMGLELNSTVQEACCDVCVFRAQSSSLMGPTSRFLLHGASRRCVFFRDLFAVKGRA